MSSLFKPMAVTFTGLTADEHLLDVQQLGHSLVGFGRAANTVTHFYLNGQVVADSRLYQVRVYAGPPRENGVLYEFLALMATSQLPLYAPLLLEMAETVLPVLWRALIERLLGRNAESDKMIELLMQMVASNDDFRRQVHDGQMADKAWLQKHIDKLTEATRNPMAEATTPVGRSCRRETLHPDTPYAVEIDEAAAQSLRSKGELQVEESRTLELLLHAVNLDTGAARAEIVGQEGQVFPVKISDPLLSQTGNPYTRALHTRTALAVVAKPTTKDGQLVKLFVSDAAVSTSRATIIH